MDLNINYALAYYTTNCNVVDLFWKTYGHALWYDTRKETYEEALKRVQSIVWEQIYQEFPHLKGTKLPIPEEAPLEVQIEKSISQNEETVNEIKACKTFAALESYKFVAKKNTLFQEAYEETFKKLKK